MNRLRRSIVVVLLRAAMALGLTCVVNGQEGFLVPVVRLVQEVKVVEEVNGQRMEVWYHPEKGGESRAKVEQYVGTGFVLLDEEGHGFLVTADHIAQRLTPTATLGLCQDGGKFVRKSLRDFLFHERDFERITWTRHEHADVAAVRINNSIVAFRKSYADMAILDKRLGPRVQEAVTVIGFPLGMLTETPCSPMLMSNMVSSGQLKLPRFDTKVPSAFFLLGNPSVGGLSGAPVVRSQVQSVGNHVTIQTGSALVGLVHGTMSDETGGKLGAVVPAQFIRDVIGRTK